VARRSLGRRPEVVTPAGAIAARDCASRRAVARVIACA
jgi:hypothetical protein